MLKVLVVCGTRPEAIKLAPVLKALESESRVEVKFCVTAQHREMLDQVLNIFNIQPYYDLNIMKEGQDLTDVTVACLTGLRDVIQDFQPDRVIVHGDTTTTISASLAAFYQQIPVSHVEAGLRTGNMYSPWPEEANRALTSVIADRHYAPTKLARENLIAEGIKPETILVTGNTVIDALNLIVSELNSDVNLRNKLTHDFKYLDTSKKIILVTGHRRENLGDGIYSICKALKELALKENIQVVFPVHLNPKVATVVYKILGDLPNIYLISPLDYVSFVYILSNCDIVITDSGGIQEEAPTLGKPVLVTRETTERPEAVEAQTVKIVGSNVTNIITEATRLLNDDAVYTAMSRAHNPYGDGTACIKIIDDICEQIDV